ncbi:MAG TPA: SPOR domain-containing protein, partial [Rhodocyclaceae bacterium]
AVPVAAVQPPAPPLQGCRRIDGVAAKDGGVFQQSLQKAGFTVAVLPMEDRSWWVIIPGLPNKAAADKKAGEVKALGITDFHVIQGERGSFVISLGVFADEAAATQFLQATMKKGVKSARIEARSKPAAALRLELRGPADLLARRLPQLMAAAPGASAVECP